MAGEDLPVATASAPVATPCHGLLGRVEWPLPRRVIDSSEEARPGFSSCSAAEFQDEPEVFAAKAVVVADLLRRSTHCLAYTGAGISTSSGIGDYATKATDSVWRRGAKPKLDDPTTAKPTESHEIFAALYRAGHLAHWLQQNHDGLPQKAGAPQHALNEIHGAWFDPSNPVVHFRAELRPDLFRWMLEEELRADLVIAVGTALCDTPSTADRVVVTAANRAENHVNGLHLHLGAVVVGLQQTRLDHRVQLRVFGLIDDFFTMVAEELWGKPWREHATVRTFPPKAIGDRETRSWLDGNRVRDMVPGQQVWITAGPYKGVSSRIMSRSPSGSIELSRRLTLAGWWCEADPHASTFPLSPEPVAAPNRFKRVVEAAVQATSFPASVGPPGTFLEGVWQGDAILTSRGRSEHPTASPERCQDFQLVLGQGSWRGSNLIGAGFTTWPAAHVLLGTRGRVWYRAKGTYSAENSSAEFNLEWESLPGSRILADGLGPGQGDAKPEVTRLSARVMWKNTELQLAGMWTDETGVEGAFLLVRRDDVPLSGIWAAAGSPAERFVLAVQPGCPIGAFGAVADSGSTMAEHDHATVSLRGFVDAGAAVHLEAVVDGCCVSRFAFDLDEKHAVLLGSPELRLQRHFIYVTVENVLGTYDYSQGGTIEILDGGEGHLIIIHPRMAEPARVLGSEIVVDGTVRLFGHLGRVTCDELRCIQWSNGSVWERKRDVSA
eukprot:TRINITY_DN43689_c0_g1_i1.p1 TRINITY_DN43689_c0_g1~~TRINITY_DN43689_c0_g1_i1.p1  ORF type:complete len:734 (-),score=77.81 TRINITY_DN43689_c0_g1_i1:370-2535(-)